MSRSPPEIELARRLLRQVAPLPGSKERIYLRLRTSQKPRARFEFRFAVVAASLLVSATAMGVGLRWVTRDATLRFTGTRQPNPSAPQQQKQNRKNGSNGAKIAVPSSSSAIEMRVLDATPPTASGVASGEPSSPAALVPQAIPRANVVARSDRNESTNPGVAAINDRRLGSVASLADETEDSVPTAQAPSELSRQVAEYHAAVDGLDANPALAIERLSAYRSHWPKSSLMHEVDLRSIEALVKLGRRNEAANAARSFLQRYPGSPRAPEMHALAHANGVE
jgi:TolA-binding protein